MARVISSLQLTLLMAFISCVSTVHLNTRSDLVEELVGLYETELEGEPDDVEEATKPGGIETLPEELDLRKTGMIHEPIYQGTCNGCGWISGTQALEARVAIVSENYIPYSLQSFMNCAGKPCIGGQPYAVTTQAKKRGMIVPEGEIPFTKNDCVKAGEGKSACYAQCGYLHPEKYTNTLHDQFVVIGGTGHAGTEEELMAALQDGPATTCFSKKSVQEGERCSQGCTHANSIIGYTKTSWLLQESYGKRWGPFDDGTWTTTKGSLCAQAVNQKAYFPRVFYDYDRANAFYKAVKDGLSEQDIQFVDKEKYGIKDSDKVNVGTAKNKCAFLGSACKGVVKLNTGTFELVAEMGSGGGDLTAFRKVQMVTYLKHERVGMYVGLKETKKGLKPVMVEKSKAAPFFSSYSRLISFDYPLYHLVDDKMKPVVEGVQNIDKADSWTLRNCQIQSDVSGKCFDLLQGRKGQNTLGGKICDPTSTSQKFDVGLSGEWILRSVELGFPLATLKDETVFTDNPKASIKTFRWNARQIINDKAHPFKPDMETSAEDFKFGRGENEMRPRSCGISKLTPTGSDDHLGVNSRNGKVFMSSEMDSNWTFEYGDL